MPRSALTGTRIRARRTDLGLRQAALAEACGISPSYLNLIEHNRRRIGGKLLIDLARALDVEVSVLSEGADPRILDDLRSAALGTPEAEGVEEFASRYPGWARIVIGQIQRIAGLEQAVETLSDRLAHDPFLSASLHDILSTATAIGSTSAILAQEKDVDPAWQDRFHRNLHEDSQRLADASRALAAYFDAGGDATKSASSPQEEFESFLEGCDYRFDAIETGAPPESDWAIIDAAPELASASAKALAHAHLAQYRKDAMAMPAAEFLRARAELGADPTALGRRFRADFPAVFRRLAALGTADGGRAIGLAVCDGSGTLVFRKPIEGFPLPRFGSACPLWPLFIALGRPMTPVHQILEIAGPAARRFEAYAIAATEYPEGFDGAPVVRSHMLILPVTPDLRDAGRVLVAGTSCRICARPACPARREISVLAETG